MSSLGGKKILEFKPKILRWMSGQKNVLDVEKFFVVSLFGWDPNFNHVGNLSKAQAKYLSTASNNVF
jgi:hypothetical protein